MTTNLIRTLAHIGDKPGTSQRDHLTIGRRVVRVLCERRQNIHTERRALRREASKLREHLPFTQRAAERLEQQAREHRAEELEKVRPLLVGYGRLILLDLDGYAESLSFQALADLNGQRLGRRPVLVELRIMFAPAGWCAACIRMGGRTPRLRPAANAPHLFGSRPQSRFFRTRRKHHLHCFCLVAALRTGLFHCKRTGI
jgi:hypothetical protein